MDGKACPFGNDVRKFGVVGSVHSTSAISKGCFVNYKEVDVSLELPFCSGNTPPEEDKVTFAQWRYAVENAKFTSSPAIHSWIFRSLRNPAAQTARNQGVGASIKQIMSGLNAIYGNVLPFDVLIRQFMEVCQEPQKSVTGYVVRLEKILTTIRENYPQELSMVDRPQHLRQRFYQGLRKELHQKMTPFYRDDNIPYMQLLRIARELEDELWAAEGIQAKGPNETDPQVKEVLAALKNPPPAKKSKTKWKGLYSCYYCGELGHWRRACPRGIIGKGDLPKEEGCHRYPPRKKKILLESPLNL